MTDDEKLVVCKNTLSAEIKGMVKQGTKSANLALNFIDTPDNEIKALEDAIIFCITMKYVDAPINRTIATVSSDDIEFCEKAGVEIHWKQLCPFCLIITNSN